MSQSHDGTSRHEPDDLALDRATGDVPREPGDSAITDDERAAATLQAGLAPRETLPASLRDRLRVEGEALVSARSGTGGGGVARSVTAGPRWFAVAASLAVAGITVVAASWMIMERNAALREEREVVAALEAKIDSNESLLADARSEVERLELEVRDRGTTIDDQRTRLAEAARAQTRLAERLARATADLDRAELAIARYEEPVDPAELKQNRTMLLEAPGTVRLAWSPFELPNAPAAEQPGVTGDVVWNDELEQGYLRFVGLDVNDPDVEQYQVWVIDERGMEQKVSGGVFNATAQGEVIVPIDPGIDVGRVALFAVTVEEPGGTWVPDLRRRVVVAPRGEG